MLLGLSDAPALLLVPWLALAADPALAARLETDSDGVVARGLAQEGVRFGAGWIVGRLCQEPFEAACVRVREGDWLLACPHLLNRDERYWSEPDRVVPERWPTASERPHYALLTFGVGGRICSGHHAVTAIVTSSGGRSRPAGR